MSPFYLIKYNFFQFLYTGLLRIAVHTSEMELTTNQQMSLPNWSFSTALLCQFQVVFCFLFFSENFNCLFFHYQFYFPFSTSDEPPKTNIFCFEDIKTIIQDKLSFWMPAPVQVSVWFTVATWNIFSAVWLCLCSGNIPIIFFFFFFLTKGSFSSWDKDWIEFATLSAALSKYWLTTMYWAL